MRFRTPIGISDFRSLREQGAAYVDKTHFVAEILADPAVALLLPRPRRFGKTLNLSTLRCFVEKTNWDASPLFADLAIWQDPDARRHFQRHPVIFLTFKDTKQSSWAACLSDIADLLAREYLRHGLLDDERLGEHDRRAIERVVRREASPVELQKSLRDLSEILAHRHGEKVVLLVDEYDTPIHASYTNGYYDEAVSFFRNFLSAGYKDNPHLFKGVLTGILRIARESLFSGLNNLAVHSILSRRYATAFGFTEAEVVAIAAAEGLSDRMDELARSYNGYLFGDQVIYNPWSIVNYFAAPENGFRPYWVATGSDDIVRGLLLGGGPGLRADLEALLRGEEIEKPVDENVVLRDLAQRPDALFSFLLFSGYLKATETVLDESGITRCRLAIPNREVRTTYETVFRSWLERTLGGDDRVQALSRALLLGHAEEFERLLEDMIVNALSYHDLGGGTPERVYQAFIVGLLVHLAPQYEVRSNRESGFGRYDIAVTPREPGKPGAILELKVLDERRQETIEQALASALSQLARKDYAAELRARGADPIHEFAAVFDGKRAWVRRRDDKGDVD